MSEPEKGFESFREGHRPTSSPSREDMTRLRVLQGRTWPDLESFRGRASPDFGSLREGRGPSGEDAPDFGSFKADLDAYVVHWNTWCRQVKLKGPTPEELQSQSLVA